MCPHDNFAYFTSLPIAEQWGDDWDDAPYEHNSGEPYRDHAVGQEWTPHTILKLAWDGPYDTPAQLATGGNSIYSVQDINRRLIPWLTPGWGALEEAQPIYAGDTVRDFILKQEAADGIVYLPRGVTIRLPRISKTRIS